jgi:hypothetical protein
MKGSARRAVGMVVVLAVPWAGCASGDRPAATSSDTGSAADACLPSAWRAALASSTVPVPGAAEPLAVVPDGRIVVRVAGRPGLSLAAADGSLEALAVPDAGPQTTLTARTDTAGRLLVTYLTDTPTAIPTTSAPATASSGPPSSGPSSSGPSSSAPPPSSEFEARDAVLVDLDTGRVQHVDPATAQATSEPVPDAVARQLEQRAGTVTVDAIAGPFVFFHPYDVSDAIEVLDTQSGSTAATGLRATGVAGSGYGVAYFGGALASTEGPASLRVVDTRALPRIDC